MEINKIYTGRNLKVLKKFQSNSIDSCVTDPPYGIKFMGKKWDYKVPSVRQWKEIYRVLKPGSHMLVACGTRTQHRMVVNIENAGFEIRDVITWHYGSGFPKSMDVSKAIDKKNGITREDKFEGSFERFAGPTGNRKCEVCGKWLVSGSPCKCPRPQDNPQSDEAKEWEGWGTALKPATEFWTLCRKPLQEDSIVGNVLRYGTGAINIDGCRIPFKDDTDRKSAIFGTGTSIIGGNYVGGNGQIPGRKNIEPDPGGRWPSNLILDEFAAAEMDKQSGLLKSGAMKPLDTPRKSNSVYGRFKKAVAKEIVASEGGASRFFYVAKPSMEEKNRGVTGDGRFMDESREEGSAGGSNPRNRGAEQLRPNYCPTVKPIELMRYLVRLITPKGGLVIDPWCGSGTTLIAAKLELFQWIGIEEQEDMVRISGERVAAWNPEKYVPQQLF